ncbi:MAG TPA: hypothetical protein ENI92_07400 [Bacteroidetes bacterium]|nr:hypothetical protein [Bacteroidota bacterium]
MKSVDPTRVMRITQEVLKQFQARPLMDETTERSPLDSRRVEDMRSRLRVIQLMSSISGKVIDLYA